MELTKSQKLILEMEKYAGGRAAVICGSLILEGDKDIRELQKAVNTLFLKNEMLRARIRESYQNVTQEITAYEEQEFEVLRFENEKELDRYGKSWAEIPLDLQSELCDFRLVILPGKYGILLKIHHIIADAWTLALLASQFSSALNNESFEAFSYADHIQKEKDYLSGRHYQNDMEYFIRQYEKLEEPVYVSGISGNQYDAKRKTFLIDRETTSLLFDYAEKRDVSVFTLFTAAFAVYMNRANTNAEKFFIGTTVLNRYGDSEKNTVGMFINTVPMFMELKNDASFLDNLEDIEGSILSVLRHQRCNYSAVLNEIHQRFGSDDKLYDVLLNYQNASVLQENARIRWYTCGRQIESLQIHIADMNRDGVLEMYYDYRLDRFSEEEILALHRHLFNLLLDAIREDSKKLWELTMLDASERQQVLTDFNKTEADYPSEETVWSLFEKNAEAKEQETCITWTGGSITFGDFRKKAEAVDAYLRSAVREKCAIGVIADRSVEELAAIYGIIRGGNAYVPISPEFPAERIKRMMELTGGKFVLAQRKYMDLWPDSVCIEDLLEKKVKELLPPALLPDDRLYIIFTSGSTGEPKGAINSCRALMNRIHWQNRKYPLTEDGTILLKTPYTFDVSVWEIFWWAMYGGRLHILPPGDHYVQKNVLGHIEEGEVTHIHFVPSVFRSFLLFLENNPEEKTKLRTLRHIILSGESLLSSDVNRFRPFNEDKHVHIHNLYGPAECAVDVTYFDCRYEESDPIPIGKPIENIQMMVLDNYLNPLPVGISGELYIGGVGVGMGYAGKPDLTAERFLDNPFGEGKIYRTGDLGYWREDGNIVCIGRKDGLIKLGGQRIETAEIENALIATDGVDEAIVLLHHSPDRLAAYYTGEALTEKQLKEALSRRLPKYMIPSQYLHLKEIPLNASGKADRRALMKMELPKAEESEAVYEAPQSEAEKEICELFAKELSVDVSQISRTTNLIDEGGTSLNVVSLLSATLLQNLTIEEIMRDPTPAGIAEVLKGGIQLSELVLLYQPETTENACVLFPYAGGNSASFTDITAEFKRLKARTALYFLPWSADLQKAKEEIEGIAEKMEVGFYSHCIGAVRAMKLLDILNQEKRTVRFFFAAANIPPSKGGINIKRILSEVLSDDMIMKILEDSGLYMGEASEEEIAAMVEASRTDAKEYHAYFEGKKDRTDTELTILLSKKDPFTSGWRTAQKIWSSYVTEVKDPVFLRSRSHYFQNTNAGQVTDLLLERFHFFDDWKIGSSS